jgi:hypothetical protein
MIDVTQSGFRRVKGSCRLHLRSLQIREKYQGVCSSMNIQGDSGGKTNILREDCIGHCEKNFTSTSV